MDLLYNLCDAVGLGIFVVVGTQACLDAGYADRIEKCRFVSQYGIGGADYWFVSGNPDYPNLDWCSALQDPTYFPDLNYAKIGGEETAVTGYARVGEYLAILKQDNAQDATIFLRQAVDTQEGVSFPLQQGVSGIGSVSARSVSVATVVPAGCGDCRHPVVRAEMTRRMAGMSRGFMRRRVGLW